MESLREKVAFVGVGYTPQGRIAGRSAISFHVEAIKNAIDDAGLNVEDIDGLLVQPEPYDPMHYDGLVHPWSIAQYMGLNLRFCASQTTMGATAGGMVLHAAAAVIYGMADYVVCSYGEAPLGGRLSSTESYYGGSEGVFGTYGFFGASAGYATAAQKAISEGWTSPDTWSDIAVNQRQWANLNPRAMMYQKTMTREDYFNSRLVTAPFRLFDICQVSDSGRAFIITTAERAKNLRHRPVYVMGLGQGHPSTAIMQSNYMTGPTGAKISGQKALEMAGLKLKDIDACEIYDCYTYTVELTLQDYGFYESGGGKAFFANGRTAPGGAFPVNTSGGLLSEVYQMGFTPLTEAIVQLQGNAGERQLGEKTNTKEPEIIMVSNNGGILQTHSTVIVRR